LKRVYCNNYTGCSEVIYTVFQLFGVMDRFWGSVTHVGNESLPTYQLGTVVRSYYRVIIVWRREDLFAGNWTPIPRSSRP
jgi:hypothetical protein